MAWHCGRLCKLADTLTTIAQLQQSIQRLRQWLIETEYSISTPLVFKHCDFTEIEEHVSCQQVTDVSLFCVIKLFYEL